MTGDCCVFKFLRRSVDGKHLMRVTSVIKFLRCSVHGNHFTRFQSVTSVIKFLRCSVHGKHWTRFLTLQCYRIWPGTILAQKRCLANNILKSRRDFGFQPKTFRKLKCKSARWNLCEKKVWKMCLTVQKGTKVLYIKITVLFWQRLGVIACLSWHSLYENMAMAQGVGK